MPIFWNPTPLHLRGSYGGVPFDFPPGKRVRIGSVKTMGQVYHAEDIASKLLEDLGKKGLIFMDEENPIPMDEAGRIGRETLAEFIKEQIRSFNEFNQGQAAENLKTYLPWKELKMLKEKILPELEAGTSEFVSQSDLDKIASREELKAIAIVQKVSLALESGDLDAIRAAIPEEMLKKLASDGKVTTEPVFKKGAKPPDPEHEFVPPQKPIGSGAGRIPNRARQPGAAGTRKPAEAAPEG